MNKFIEMLFGKRDSVETRSARKLRLESLEDRHLLDGAGLLSADMGAFDVAEAENVAPAIEQGIITVTLDDDGPIDHSDDFNADGSPNRITLREAFDYVGKFGSRTYTANYYQGLQTHSQLSLNQARLLNYIRTIEISESVETIELNSSIFFSCDYFNDAEGEFDSTISVNGNSATITRDGGRAFVFLRDDLQNVTHDHDRFPDYFLAGESGVILNDLNFSACGTTEFVYEEYTVGNGGHQRVRTDYGGAIYSMGFRNFGLNNCTFDSNSCHSGGAVYSFCTNFYVNDSTFINNSTSDGIGGAITNVWNGRYSNCTFESNGTDGMGGAVYGTTGFNTVSEWSVPGDETDFTFDNCTFVENVAKSGGAVYISSSGINYYSNVSVVTMEDCVFERNESSYYAGAMYAEGQGSLKNVSFTDNVADTGDGGGCYLEGYRRDNGDDYWSLTDCTFTGNEAAYGGGARVDAKALLASNCTFENNVTSGSGGAVYSRLVGGGTDECTFQYLNCTFDSNTAGGSGGGVYASGWHSFSDCNFESGTANSNGGAISCASSRLDVNGGSYKQNSAQLGGAVYCGEAYFTGVSFVEDYAGSSGGAIRMKEGGIVNCTFTENSAGMLGGSAVYKDSGYGETGATLSITGSYFEGNQSGGNGTVSAAGGVLTIQDVEFVDNAATGNGGAVMFNSSTETTLESVRFSGNAAGRNGGAVYAGGQLSVDSCVFENNSTSGSGGAVNSTYAGDSTIENSEFDGNTAVRNGGALCFASNSGTQTLSQNTFQNNVALNGGAIYMQNASATSEGDNFYYNGASENARYGGAIYLYSGELTLTDDAFENNGYYESVGEEGDEANIVFSVRGGAIYNGANGVITGVGLAFDYNYGYYGGAIYNKGELTISGSQFTGNEAYLGGAVYNHAQGVASLLSRGDATVFYDNVARFSDVDAQTHGSGGAIYQSGSVDATGALYIDGVEFQDNVASKYGGAIANYLALTTDDVYVLAASFDSNVAAIGGAIANAGVIGVEDSTFDFNAAYAASDSESFGIDLYTLGGRGGAIYSANNATTGSASSLTLVGHNSFSMNSATVSGGAINVVSGEINFDANVGDSSETRFEFNTALNGFGGALVLANGLDNVNINAPDSFSFDYNEAWYAKTIAVNAKFGDDYKALVEAFGFDYSDLSLDQVATFTRYANDLKDETLTFEYLADFSAEHSSDYVTVRYAGETSTGEVTLSAGEEVTLRELGVPYDEEAGHCVGGSYKIEFYYGQAGEESPDNLFELMVGVTGDDDYMTIRRITMNGDGELGERQLMEGFSFITYDLPIEAVSIDWGDGSAWYSEVGSFSTNVYHMFPAKGEGAEDDTYSVVCDLKLVGSSKHIVVGFDYQAYGSLDHIVPGTIETYFDDAFSAAFADEDLVADLFND